MAILNLNRRQAVRSVPNPLDKSTVFSILPKEIHETKPTIQPGTFIIPPGSYENPARLIVTSSSWWRELDPEQPLLEIPISSIQVADSIVKDYCNGILGCNMSDAMPGIFFIPGEIELSKLKTEYKNVLDKAKEKQAKWFNELVRMADTLWARTNGNPLSIADDMRMAAKELGLDGREWIRDFKYLEMIRCIACGQMRNPAYPVCPHCKAIVDLDKAKTLKLSFAQ